MKKAIISILAITLTTPVCAIDNESLRDSINLQNMDPVSIEDASITNIGMPVDLGTPDEYTAVFKEVWNRITELFHNTENNPSLTYTSAWSGNQWTCADAAGNAGYNKITVAELLNNPKLGECIDLRRTNLNESQLANYKLTSANLSEANLIQANMIGINLRGAIMEGANLYNANLKNSVLYKTELRKANLIAANMVGANLFMADLREANLSNANLSKAHLFETDLRKVNFNGTILFGAFLSESNLSGVDLSKADLRKTCMYKADLRNADLRGADLLYNMLGMADLRGANFEGADMRGTYLKGAIYNDDTILPFDDTTAKQRGMIKTYKIAYSPEAKNESETKFIKACVFNEIKNDTCVYKCMGGSIYTQQIKRPLPYDNQTIACPQIVFPF